MKFFLCQNGVMDPELNSSYSHSRPPIFSVQVVPNPKPSSMGAEAEFWKEMDNQPAGSGARGNTWLRCELYDNGATVGFGIKAGPVTRALKETFGKNVSVQVRISGFILSQWGNIGNVETSKMKVRKGVYYACEDPDLIKGVCEFSTDYLDPQYDCRLYGMVTVMVDTHEMVDISATPLTDKMKVHKKVLQEGIHSDLVVIPENGVEVKAHRAMLAGHSDVLSAMFESDMQEAKIHKLEMPDMTEAGVRGLLAYLYCWEETGPNSKPLVAYEMLYAGHKYNIPDLETAMKKMILNKPILWFEVDVAMKLFLFAKNLPGTEGEGLKKKAIQVLKINFATLKESPTYATLFEENPKAAMELCAYAFGNDS